MIAKDFFGLILSFELTAGLSNDDSFVHSLQFSLVTILRYSTNCCFLHDSSLTFACAVWSLSATALQAQRLLIDTFSFSTVSNRVCNRSQRSANVWRAKRRAATDPSSSATLPVSFVVEAMALLSNRLFGE